MAAYKIVYMGSSDIRRMPQQDLKKYNVDVPEDLVWNFRNRWTLVVDNMTDALADIFRRERTFLVTEVGEGEVPDNVVVEGKSLDDTGLTVRDMNTGQVSEKD